MCRVLGIRRGAGYESCIGSRERCRICVMYWEYGEVQGMCRVLGIGRVAQRVLEVKPERKRTFVKPNLDAKIILKLIFEGIRWQSVWWIDLVQEM